MMGVDDVRVATDRPVRDSGCDLRKRSQVELLIYQELATVCRRRDEKTSEAATAGTFAGTFDAQLQYGGMECVLQAGPTGHSQDRHAIPRLRVLRERPTTPEHLVVRVGEHGQH